MDWCSYIASAAKTAPKKIGALICSIKFPSVKVALYPYKFTIWPYIDYCSHGWPGAPSRSNNSGVISVKMDASALNEKWSNGLVVKAQDSQSRGFMFKTSGWLQV